MSFSISKRKGNNNQTTEQLTPTLQAGVELYIIDYSEKAFVVLGDTISHANALHRLGGKYVPNLRIGAGWLFTKLRKPSVENYIKTGEVAPFAYSEADRQKYNAQQNDKRPKMPTASLQLLKTIFREFREAFDEHEEYDGQTIHDVIYKLEEKYIHGNVPIQIETHTEPQTELQTELQTEQSEGEQEEEDGEDNEQQQKQIPRKRLAKRI